MTICDNFRKGGGAEHFACDEPVTWMNVRLYPTTYHSHISVIIFRFKIVEGLCRTNTESLCEVYPQIIRLQCLEELEKAKKIQRR